jgi:IS5 family transposase
MRKSIEPQLKFGETDPSQIQFDVRSRDETTKLLIGLQHIYQTSKLRDQVFTILRGVVPDDVDVETGRPGMPLWTIFVLGAVRLNSNLNYDKVKDLADYHRKIREMIGHSIFDHTPYALQTLKDNVKLLTSEVLAEINQVVVQAGHDFVGGVKKKELAGKYDSFVVETNVDYPTDITLLFDAVRKAITLTARLCLLFNISGWRQFDHNIKNIKRLLRKVQNLKRSTSKDAKTKKRRDQHIQQAYESYLETTTQLIERVEQSVALIRLQSDDGEQTIETIESFLRHAKRQTDQIRRRIFEGQTIAHEEKVFSIFQEHTE